MLSDCGNNIAEVFPRAQDFTRGQVTLYFENTNGVIFVVDSNDRDRAGQAVLY